MSAILPEFRSVSGLLVAGGLASRMGGGEKAFLKVGGSTIAERTLRLFRPLFAETLVATPRPAAWTGLPVRIVADEAPGDGSDAGPTAGPLAGLAAGLAAARTPWVFACAGDMPLLDARFIRFACSRALATGRTTLPRLGGRPEPLHGVWRARDAGRARQALDAGIRKMTAWLHEGEVEWLDIESLRGLPDAAVSLRNVNSPEDLADAGRVVDARRHRGETSPS